MAFKQYGDFIFNCAEVEYLSLHSEVTDGGRHYEVGVDVHLKSGSIASVAPIVIHGEQICEFLEGLERTFNES